jgi:beta-ureidopropionase / N-carbamoyl-L-amino-acid hydrolase
MGASVPDHFEEMWRTIEPLGLERRSGGYFRQPFTSVERELDAWFVEQAAARGLRLETDAFGNRVAWWDPGIVPDASVGADGDLGRERQGLSLPGVVTGSHLDSVLDGGAYDGPLGVVSALAAVEVLRERGFRPARPIGVSVFVEEEGSRFGLACLGSRLATGAIEWARARALRDRDGVRLDEAMASVGLAGEDPRPWLGPDRVSCFVELHVEQGRDLVDRGDAVGVASRIWPHGRYRFEISGEANHAGTTRMEDRRDPMLTYAMTALAASKQARLAGQRATFGRVETAPNSTNSVPSGVTAWLDARCETDEALATLVEAITRQATERADRDGTTLTVTAESVSSAVDFDADLARRIAGDHEPGDWPVLPTQAGHDAGILSAQGIPSAMIFVRNPTGVSHSPAEHAELPDCLAGVDALAETLERLAS